MPPSQQQAVRDERRGVDSCMDIVKDTPGIHTYIVFAAPFLSSFLG